MKNKTNKAQTVRELQRVIRSLEYYIKTYLEPYQDEVFKNKASSFKFQVSGAYYPDSYLAADHIIKLKNAIKTIKKLKK